MLYNEKKAGMLSTKPSRVVIRVIGESFLISFGGGATEGQFTDKSMFIAKTGGEWISRGGHLKQVFQFNV